MYVVVRCRQTLLPQYLLYLLKSDIGKQYIKHRSAGAVRFQLRYADLEQIEIPIPPISEQKKIVGILDEADQLLQMRQQADLQTNSLIPAIFQEMFGDGTTFPQCKLFDICGFITKGTTPKASDIKTHADEGDIPFLKVYHVTDSGKIDFHYEPSYISRDLHNGLLARSKVYPHDVLMNIVGPPLGKIGIVPPYYPEWNINQALAIFRARENLVPIYLLHALRSPKILADILANAAGVRQLNISLEQCRNIKIPLPPLSLQREFEERVKMVRDLGPAQAKSRQQIYDLFRQLTFCAFTGEL